MAGDFSVRVVEWSMLVTNSREEMLFTKHIHYPHSIVAVPCGSDHTTQADCTDAKRGQCAQNRPEIAARSAEHKPAKKALIVAIHMSKE